MHRSELSDLESTDSDEEIQTAFAHGRLKPALNIEVSAPRAYINNVTRMKQKLVDMKSDFNWVERLAISSDLAPTHAAIIAAESKADDEVHNDFKREMKFYRQAQATALEGLARLKALKIPTKRPEDFFAEMAKSDVHMKKVREKLLSKQVQMDRSEKARKMRELRKYGKQVQVEVLQKRQKEKKEMLESIKKYRKGRTDNLDFLNDEKDIQTQGKKRKKAGDKTSTKGPNKKRQKKNEKFGYGGQKKRSKWNTAESSADVSGFNPKKHAGAFKKKFINKNKTKRPGKMVRQKMKGRSKK